MTHIYADCVFCGNEHCELEEGYCIRCAGFLVEVDGCKEDNGLNKRCADGCEEVDDDTGRCLLCNYWRDVYCGQCGEETIATSCILEYDHFLERPSRTTWRCIECWVEPGMYCSDDDEEADE